MILFYGKPPSKTRPDFAFASFSICRRCSDASANGIDDILRIANVSDAQISPDGAWVVYTVSTVDGDGSRSTLWIARTASDPSQTALETARPAARRNPPTQLLTGGWNATNPRWSPDSRRIAFLASEKDQTSLYVVSLDNRQPRRLRILMKRTFILRMMAKHSAGRRMVNGLHLFQQWKRKTSRVERRGELIPSHRPHSI